MYGNEHEILQRELPTRIKPRGKAGPPLPANTNDLRRLAGSVVSRNTPRMCFNNELLEEYLQLQSKISPMGIGRLLEISWTAAEGTSPAFLAQVSNGGGHREHLRIKCCSFFWILADILLTRLIIEAPNKSTYLDGLYFLCLKKVTPPGWRGCRSTT